MNETAPPAPRSRGFWLGSARRFLRYTLGVIGLCIVLFLFFVAFFAPLLANEQPIICKYDGKVFVPGIIDTLQNIPLVSRVLEKPRPFRFASFNFKSSYDPDRGDWALFALIPYGPMEIAADRLLPPSGDHWLGTDEVGRDVLARLIYGTGVSMKVGFISMGIAVLIGLIIGSIAGYAGGWTDMIVSRFIEIITCFPTFFLILGILAWFPPRIENVMIIIGLTGWTGISRYVRAEFIRLRENDFTLAARVMGAGPFRIIFIHLLPNSLAPVMVSVTFGIANAILTEAGLSWLGFGVQPPQPSWGNILRSGYDNLFTAPHLIPPPSVAIFIAVLAFNLVGDTLRDVIDPRLEGSDSSGKS